MRSNSIASKVLLLGVASGGCFFTQSQGEKRRIAIYDFDYSSVKTAVIQNLGADSNIGHNVAEMLLSPLTESGAYEVMDRARIETVLKEQNLKFSSRFDPSQAIAYGKVLQVDAIVAGTVNDLNVEVIEKTKGLLGVGRKSVIVKATVELTAQMISTETGQIYLAPSATGSATDEIGSGNGGTIKVPGSRTGQTDNGEMGSVKHSSNYAAPVVRKAIHEALNKIAKEMIEKASGLPKRVVVTRGPAKPGPGLASVDGGKSLVANGNAPLAPGAPAAGRKPISAQVMEINNDIVFIDKGAKAGVQVGDSFEVRRYLKTAKTGAGKLVKLDQKIGVLQITEVNDDWASGKYTGDQPAQKSDAARFR